MDYVREELLRQQAVLAALMGGGRESETAEQAGQRRAAGGAEERLAGDLSGEWMDSALEGGETNPGEMGPRVRLAGSGATRPDALRTGRPSAPGFYGVGGRERPAAWQETMGPVLRMRAGLSEVFAGGGLGSPDRSAVQGSADVQAVSRAIQRDARRYDGGFTIY